MTLFVNKFGLQISDTVRLIIQDERAGISPGEIAVVSAIQAECVMTLQNARALRDMLVQHIKDDVLPGAMN